MSVYSKSFIKEESSSDDPRDWIFRDPLRGWSLDDGPYEREKGEVKLDFIFKSVLYTPCVFFGMINFPWLALCAGLWIGINYLRRNG